MSITDELRHEVASYPFRDNRDFALFEAIADRIDAKHDEALSRKFVDAVLYGTEFVTMPASEMAERYIELPKDADGEYIHMGDRMENGELVARIVLTDGSWEPSVYTAATPNQLHEYYCHDIGHYHEPTVENVLREFAHAILNQKAEYLEQNIAEYAAKLRLSDDGKEQQ